MAESTKSWEEICREVDSEFDREDKTAYRFSNGRRFEAEGVQGEDAPA